MRGQAAGRRLFCYCIGYPQTHVMWHRVAPSLAAQFEIIMPDMPGYGLSAESAFFPFPETMIAGTPDAFVSHCLQKWLGYRERFDPQAYAAYLEAFRRSDVIAATCEDYRAGTTIDKKHGHASVAEGLKIACPVMLLWGSLSFGEDVVMVLGLWRDYAENLQGAALDAEHFVAEEAPDEVIRHLTGFLNKN